MQQHNQNHSHNKSGPDLGLRKPDVDASDFAHGNPKPFDAQMARSVTGSNSGSHDRAFGECD